jgi:hypothetical protein
VDVGFITYFVLSSIFSAFAANVFENTEWFNSQTIQKRLNSRTKNQLFMNQKDLPHPDKTSSSICSSPMTSARLRPISEMHRHK